MSKIKTILIAMSLFALVSSISHAFCFEEAGEKYGINPRLLRAIAKIESNFKPKVINYNSNGSFDYGLMQINSSWYPVLGKETWNNLDDPCTNVMVGAQILSGCLKRYGYTWRAVGCYNAKSDVKRVVYVAKAKKVYERYLSEDNDDGR